MLYLDSSALVKLVLTERETGALREHLRDDHSLATSVLAVTEVIRAVRRVAPSIEADVRPALSNIVLLDLSAEILELASAVPPPTLRSLDAIHIATALALGDELDAIVTYDMRMADAARLAGLRVDAPV